MKQSEVDVIKAAAKLHTAVTAYGRHSVEADVAIAELVAIVDKSIARQGPPVPIDSGTVPQ